jgi:methionyl-tRNA synthetase
MPSDLKTVYFVSNTIPYVNARPHLGHMLEFVQTDTIARYRRSRGSDVYYLSGSDENSLKNVLAAAQEGITTRELVDRNVIYFTDLRADFDLSYDYFIRTSVDPLHLKGAARVWQTFGERGDVYKSTYSGLYCVGCEQYYTEEELVDGLCPEHGTRPELVEEENYFFRLSRYQDQVCRVIESGEMEIVPESRKNEVLGFIKQGLRDIPISRSQARARGWGIPVPGDPNHVMYVWIDALTNYINALGYAEDSPRFRHYWLNADSRVHVLGKGVIRFHAVYWPAMLCSLGVPLPTSLFVHGYITASGQKLSKSRGLQIDAPALAARYGYEALRYYLLAEVPPTLDADFTEERLVRRYNADLANELGNLANRVLSMIWQYRAGVVPRPGRRTQSDERVIAAAGALDSELAQAMDGYDLRGAMGTLWRFIRFVNAYVSEEAPWKVAGESAAHADATKRLDTILQVLHESLRLITVQLDVFLPRSAGRLMEQISPETRPGHFGSAWTDELAGTRVAEPRPVFPRHMD